MSQKSKHQVFDPMVGHPRRKLVLAIMCGALILVVASVSSLNVAIPTIVRELDATQSEQLWIIDAYALVFAGLLLPAGALGDRFGRKNALLFGLAVFGVASAVAALATDPAQLIALRAIMGIGAAAIMPATLSIITQVFPPMERGKAIATWAGFAGAGGAIGPLASGALLEKFWWGSVFFIAVPIVLAMLVAVVMVVPTTQERHATTLDPIGALLSIVALGSLVFAIIEGSEWGWTAPSTLGVFALAAVALAAFVAFELRSDTPMLDPRLFRIRRFTIGSVTISNAFLVMFGMFYVLTLYLQFVQGHSALGAAVRQLPFPATMILLAPRSPSLVHRFGARNVVTFGFALQAIALLNAAMLDADSSYLRLVFTLVFAAAGMSIMMPTTTEAIVASLPPEKAGVGSAVNDTVREVGGAIGIALFGALISVGYRGAMGSSVSALPETLRSTAEDSIGGAAFAAGQAEPSVAGPLMAAARQAQTDGMTLAFGAAVIIAVLTGIYVYLAFPRTPAVAPVTDLRAAPA